jgi:uncharacterized glyoxalase superfamily protein PhnB
MHTTTAPALATTRVSVVSVPVADLPAGCLQGLVLTTEDVHGDVAALRERGVAFAADPVEASYGTYADPTDPDGNGWTLLQEPAGA